jgi:hypothetical protein
MSEEQVRSGVIASAKEAIQATRIPLTSANLGWDSCNDDGTAPFRASIYGFFPGAATFAESERAVDGWARVLVGRGWSLSRGRDTDVRRYLGKGTMGIWLDPAAAGEQTPPAFTVLSQCVVLEDMSKTPMTDVLAEITGRPGATSSLRPSN